ncbi:transmembrane protein, putative (macronuclear) [Tetrahymena thermophila SB210]|uniref:Transmembrane protein, putative n=1 Tax=Tetrahymena thermophila (strain SB210) TaxID=312017 RepID=W7XCM7_TETTS|nr:transmembrane protein, putative [Tetrahymena thermophila SB210]EWS71531.1 transmembrane protein, putative [Tetrahymena thermophila SB210]|eukprot:XP_012655942.1 transmembrane protein, putative [Tetrahymena thermophila SB210]
MKYLPLLHSLNHFVSQYIIFKQEVLYQEWKVGKKNFISWLIIIFLRLKLISLTNIAIRLLLQLYSFLYIFHLFIHHNYYQYLWNSTFIEHSDKEYLSSSNQQVSDCQCNSFNQQNYLKNQRNLKFIMACFIEYHQMASSHSTQNNLKFDIGFILLRFPWDKYLSNYWCCSTINFTNSRSYYIENFSWLIIMQMGQMAWQQNFEVQNLNLMECQLQGQMKQDIFNY